MIISSTQIPPYFQELAAGKQDTLDFGAGSPKRILKKGEHIQVQYKPLGAGYKATVEILDEKNKRVEFYDIWRAGFIDLDEITRVVYGSNTRLSELYQKSAGDQFCTSCLRTYDEQGHIKSVIIDYDMDNIIDKKTTFTYKNDENYEALTEIYENGKVIQTQKIDYAGYPPQETINDPTKHGVSIFDIGR